MRYPATQHRSLWVGEARRGASRGVEPESVTTMLPLDQQAANANRFVCMEQRVALGVALAAKLPGVPPDRENDWRLSRGIEIC